MTMRTRIIIVFTTCLISLTAFWSCDSQKQPPPKAVVVKKKIAKPTASKARRMQADKSKQTKMRPKSDVAMAAPNPAAARIPSSAKPTVKSSMAKQTAAATPTAVTPSTAQTPAAAPKPSRTTNLAPSPKADIALAAKSRSQKGEATAAQAAAPSAGPKPKAEPAKMGPSGKKPVQTASAGKAKATNKKGQPAPYDPTGKIDPFEPLFKDEPKVPVKKARKKRVPRTPLERISLSQLKLVGIIMASSGNRALVQDSTKKGYIIKEGTYIGMNSGKVTEIRKDAVIIEEEVETILGNVTKNKKELKLPKPTGE